MPPSEEELRKAFATFDTDGSGALSVKELTAILQRGSSKDVHSAEEAERVAERLMNQFDLNSDGELEYDEFIAWWVGALNLGDEDCCSQPAEGGVSAETQLKEGVGQGARALLERYKDHTLAPEDADIALAAFTLHRLEGDDLDAMNATRRAADPDAEDIPATAVVLDAARLRLVFAELGDEVERQDLFELVQLADPEAEGVVTVPQWLEVVRVRQAFLQEKEVKRNLQAGLHAWARPSADCVFGLGVV